MKRTHTCGEPTAKQIGKEIVLEGWVDTRRDHGPLTFVDIRDRFGTTQTVCNAETHKDAHDAAKKLGRGYVVRVSGKLQKRPKGTENPKIPTGEVELAAEKIELLNDADTLPLETTDHLNAGEDTRLRHRYLDLRRPVMQNRLAVRHRVIKALRDYFDSKGFLEIETPILAKSTPEGARDFLVPSRAHAGNFFALPQSPQLFKQLLMVAGYDRYVQMARCFRDEDLRADRQPEFTQLDVEMSFVDEEDVYGTIEGAVAAGMKAVGIDVKTPFPRMPYDEAMSRFGSDKPDTRFALELCDLTEIAKEADFEIFKKTIANAGVVSAISIPKGESFSKKDQKKIEDVARVYGAKGAIIAPVSGGAFSSGVATHISEAAQKKIIGALKAKDGELVVMVADEPRTARTALGQIRLHAAQKLGLVDEQKNHFLWVVDFPMFEWSKEHQRWSPSHHPFTQPKPGHVELMKTDPAKAKARAYDIVWNGVELGGGSIRIHQRDMQMKVFDALGLSEKEYTHKFGFLLNAFRHGAPPHGGIALGLDRWIMLIARAPSIRDVMAFPKNKAGVSLMEGAPSDVSDEQLREQHISVVEEDTK